jgi:His-Xaa-Ser system protein HxsD
MENVNFILDGEIVVYVDAALFSKDVVFKSLYWYGDKFHTRIATEVNAYVIRLKPMENAAIKEDDLGYYLQKFERDIVDYSLREIVNNETVNIRELLVAKAFSNGEYDEDPQGNVSDTVGFDPLSIGVNVQSQ